MPKILFIRLNMSGTKSTDAMQPLVFAILDHLTPPHYERTFVDDCIEEINFSVKADLVALTFGTYAAKRAYGVAERFKSQGSVIVMGGFHVTAMPDEASEYADSIVIGDAETTWPQLLSDYENNKLQRVYKSDNSSPTFSTTLNRDVFKGKKYFPANVVQWGRGCRHNCDFCSVNAFYSGRKSLRPIEEVIHEIKGLDNKPIFFADDNIFHDKHLFLNFLEQLKPLKKRWACQISMDVTREPQLVKLMKEAGCLMVLFGIETFSKENLKLMNKGWNLGENNYTQAIATFRKYGIMIYGTFIFGYDYDTTESFEPAVRFSIKNKLFLANYNPLYPMPGTRLYERFQKEQRLEFDKWWLNSGFYYGRTMFRPVSMTPLDLEQGCFENKKKFNSLRSIFYRLTDLTHIASFRNAVLFLLVNFTNRREVYRKQNKKLGLQ